MPAFSTATAATLPSTITTTLCLSGRLELQPFKGKIFGEGSFLKFGGDVLNSRDEQGVNISQSSNLLVNSDGSLSPFTLPSADERTAWSVDAWLRMGPFDLIG